MSLSMNLVRLSMLGSDFDNSFINRKIAAKMTGLLKKYPWKYL